MNDLFAELRKLFLDAGLVVLDCLEVVRVLGLVLHLEGADSAPSGPATGRRILVGGGVQGKLLRGEFDVKLRELLGILDHVLVSFALLGDLCHRPKFLSLFCQTHNYKPYISAASLLLLGRPYCVNNHLTASSGIIEC